MTEMMETGLSTLQVLPRCLLGRLPLLHGALAGQTPQLVLLSSFYLPRTEWVC